MKHRPSVTIRRNLCTRHIDEAVNSALTGYWKQRDVLSSLTIERHRPDPRKPCTHCERPSTATVRGRYYGSIVDGHEYYDDQARTFQQIHL